MNTPHDKRTWNVGRELSENYEWFDHVIIASLKQFDSEEELLTWLKTPRNRKGVRIRKGPLGSTLLKLLDKEKSALSLTLQVHLIFENFMNEIIKNKFRNSELILEGRLFSFAAKLALLRAKNYLSAPLFNDFKLLNSLRNKFSHNLFYDIGEFDMSKFSYCDSLTEVYENIFERNHTLSLINFYMLKSLAFHWLLRLTSQHPFIGSVRTPKHVLTT